MRLQNVLNIYLIELGFTGIDGIADTTMETEELTGGYAGNKFQIPNVVKDETDSLTIKVYEFSGSPIREFIDTWMTGISDPLTGLSHYHGVQPCNGNYHCKYRSNWYRY